MWQSITLTLSGVIAGLWLVWKYINYYKMKKHMKITEYISKTKNDETSHHKTLIGVNEKQINHNTLYLKSISIENDGFNFNGVLIGEMDNPIPALETVNTNVLLPEMKESDEEDERSQANKNDMK